MDVHTHTHTHTHALAHTHTDTNTDKKLSPYLVKLLMNGRSWDI